MIRCLFCIKEINSPIYKKRKFCSLKCYWQCNSKRLAGKNNPNWKNGKTKLTCIVCRKEWETYINKHNANKFCSKICYYKSSIGRKLSLKTREKLSKIHIGQVPWNKGKKLSPETVGKMRNNHLGEKSIFWRGGKMKNYPENERVRKSSEYKIWRKSIFERDKYTCQHCKKIGGILNADHIKPFSEFPELRLDLKNGRTLCLNCHKKVTLEQNKKRVSLGIEKREPED
jgi:hypothetical protein